MGGTTTFISDFFLQQNRREGRVRAGHFLQQSEEFRGQQSEEFPGQQTEEFRGWNNYFYL